jgi:hypothetical protein
MPRRKMIKPDPSQDPKEFYVAYWHETYKMRQAAVKDYSATAAARYHALLLDVYERIPRDEALGDLDGLTDAQLSQMVKALVSSLPMETAQDLFCALAEDLNYPLKPRLVVNNERQ